MEMLRMIVAVGVMRCSVYVIVRRRVAVRDDYIDLCAGETAAADPAHFKSRTHVERSRGLFEQGEGYACVDEGTEQHVAADAGEAF